MNSRLVCVLAVLATALPFSCKKSSSNSGIVGSIIVGGDGGELVIDTGPLAGTAIRIPPGALTENTQIAIYQEQFSKTTGVLAIGPAARFEPNGFVLAAAAIVTLPFTASMVPSGTETSDFIVRGRDHTGMLFELTPASVDPDGSVTVEVTQLATLWVAVPDIMVATEHFPLKNADNYVYDTGLTLFVSHTTSEPNFGSTDVIKLTFSNTGITTGLYLAIDANNNIRKLGDFRVPDFQEKFDSAIVWLNAKETLSAQNKQLYSYLGYVPYGGLVVRYTGIAEQIAAIGPRTNVGTVIKNFENVIECTFTVDFSNTIPRFDTTTMKLWLAPGVGPVRVALENQPVATLVSGTANGRPIE